MKFDTNTPISLYELIAIIFSAIALITPIIKMLYNKVFKRLKIDFLPSDIVTVYYNKSGSYISFGGVFDVKNKPVVISKMSVKITRKSDMVELPLDWSTFSSPTYRRIAGAYESTYERAHPIRVEANSLVPLYVEFESVVENLEEKSNKTLDPVYRFTNALISSDQSITVSKADAVVRASEEAKCARLALHNNFFWKEDEYIITLVTSYNKKTLLCSYCFSLSDEESKKLQENLDNLIVGAVADRFKLKLNMNTIRKKCSSVDK